MNDPSAPVAVDLAPADQGERFRTLPASQQPEWPDPDTLHAVLAALPRDGLVDASDSRNLRAEITSLATTGGLVLQLGDCVEDIDTDVYADTRTKLAFIDAAADHLAQASGRPILTVGRIAGQHAKPRSNEYETIDGRRLPVYRGPIVNAHHATDEARRPSPANITRAHDAARIAHTAITAHRRENRGGRLVWTSHELLLIDYELRFLRDDDDGFHLSTTHWPWIGARTRQPDGAHIAIAASLTNPVSVKIGPDTSPDEAVHLSILLNPRDEPGKVTFIARMGSERIDQIADVARAVRKHGRTVQWLTDPMHGNTVTTSRGFKTRHVENIVAEIEGFQRVLLGEGIRPAGLHLEATPDDVHECAHRGHEPVDRRRYRSLLDPRLNPEQAMHVLDAWYA